MGTHVKRARGPNGETGWAATVRFGTTAYRRYLYRTRQDARNGDISDEPGWHGCICMAGVEYQDDETED